MINRLVNFLKFIALVLFWDLLIGLFLPTGLHAKDCETNLTGAVEKLPTDIAETLKVSAAAFCGIQQARKQPIHPVRITGTSRSISDQARYIYQCMQRNGCAIYENQEAVTEYKAIKNLTRLKLERQIKDQLKRNCFISKHLSNRAVDIGTRDMSKYLVSQLAQLISDTEYYVDGKK